MNDTSNSQHAATTSNVYWDEEFPYVYAVRQKDGWYHALVNLKELERRLWVRKINRMLREGR